MHLISTFFVVAVAAGLASADSDYTSTCGGFVKSNSVPIGLDKVKVKLVSSTGNLRGETEVSPAGDYVLAVYNKGKYQVRVEGPSGWAFDPPQIEVDLDGSAECPQNLDFTFKGFSVIGKVLSRGSKNGPAGVDITLVEGGSKRTLQTQEGGNFVFPAVRPGKYQLLFRGESVDVEVKNDNLKTNEGQFVIEGYSIKGSIEWEAPLSSATIILANEANVPCCGKRINKDLPAGFRLPSNLKLSCVIKADSSGAFQFPCVEAASNYALFAHVLTESKQPMEIAPNKMEFNLPHKDMSLEPFQVTGFPVTGSVSLVNGHVAVKVLETGQIVSSDAEGNFKLNSLRSGKYTLQLSLPGYEFEPREIQIDQKTATIPTIEPDRFEVCGTTQLSEAVEISMKNIRGGEVQKVWSQLPSKTFCVFLAKGDYVFEPKHSKRLSPAMLTVAVPLSKNKRIVFSEFQATVKGHVECIGKTCAGVRVVLKEDPGSPKGDKTADSLGNFVFDKVDPGNYQICLSHETYCFERDCKAITVIDSDIDVAFQQKGFHLKIESSHVTDVEVDNKILRIKAGSSSICVAGSKIQKVKPLGCHKFANEEGFVHDPAKNEKLVMQAVSHRLRIRVESQLVVTDLSVEVTASGSPKQVLKLMDATQQDNLQVYTAELFFPKGTEVTVEASSNSLVFKPSQAVVRMPDDCVGALIFGKTGIQIEGSIKPPIADVQVTITSGDSKPATVTTGADGKYRAGPLDSQEIEIEASKAGYGFERIGRTNDFSAIKYSRIDIVAVQEDTNEPLASALVVITGVNGTEYRNSTKTAANGELSLIKLTPGSYNVRVMMKEYSFEPKAKEIKIGENSEERLVIKGKKIFFSIIGRISSIAGESEGGVWIEAVSQDCDKHEEDALSDEKGAFRIRGLRENCVYDVKLKNDERNKLFEKTLPRLRKVQVGKKDINLDLMVVRSVRSTQVSVAFRVDDPALMNGLVMHVISEDSHVVGSLAATEFAYLPGSFPLDGKTYHVDFQMYNAALPPHLKVTLVGKNETDVSFAADKPYRHLELQVHVNSKEAGGEGQETLPSSPFAIVFPMLVALALLYRNELLMYWRQRQDAPATGDRRKNRR